MELVSDRSNQPLMLRAQMMKMVKLDSGVCILINQCAGIRNEILCFGSGDISHHLYESAHSKWMLKLCALFDLRNKYTLIIIVQTEISV